MDAELERNPLLARDDRDGEAQPEAAEVQSSDTATDRIDDSAARADMDVRHDDVSPGERATGDDAASEGAADAGGAVDWSRAGSGGSSFDGDADALESALSRDKTLNEHLHDQLAVAGLSGPALAAAMVLIDSVDEGGYLRAELAEVADRLGCEGRVPGDRAGHPARLRAGGRLRPRPARMPDAAAQGPQPLRPGHGRAARQPAAAGPSRHAGPEEGLRRRRRGPARDGRRTAGADAAARRGLRRRSGAGRGARRLRQGGPRRPLARGAEFRDLAPPAGGPALPRPRQRLGPHRPGEDLRLRLRGPGEPGW